MRIAICISGEMRNFNNPLLVDSFNSFVSNISNLHSVDTFVSTWSHIGFSYNSDYNSKIKSPISKRDDIVDMRYDIQNIYNPITLEIEGYDNWVSSQANITSKMSYNLIGGEVVTSPPQLYKIYKCNQLKRKYEIDSNFKYDVVIRARPDLIYLNNIDLSNINSINHINFGIVGSYWPNRVFDIFFYSNSYNMDLLCKAWESIISDIESEFDNGLDKRDACRLLYINCMKNNLNVNDLKTRICAVYRNELLNVFHSHIKKMDGI